MSDRKIGKPVSKSPRKPGTLPAYESPRSAPTPSDTARSKKTPAAQPAAASTSRPTAAFVRGNAFSEMRARGIDTSKLPRKSSASSDPSSPNYKIPRIGSSLDYDRELAIPMPKPPQRRYNTSEKSGPSPNPAPFSHLRKGSLPEAVVPNKQVDNIYATVGKKRSRLQTLKSKLSFKDLHKEATTRDQVVPPLPSGLSSEKHDASKVSVPGSPAAPATCESPRIQDGTANSRLSTPSSVPGAKVDLNNDNEKPAVGPIPRLRPKASTSPSSPGLSTPEGLPPKSKTSLSGSSAEGDTPPTHGDRSNGSSRFKYLPRLWPDNSMPSTPSPAPRAIHPAHRLLGAGLTSSPLSKTVSQGDESPGEIEPLLLESTEILETGDLSPYAAEFAKIVRAIQGQTDIKINKLSVTVSELSKWVHDQLDARAADIEDIKRTNAELLSRMSAVQEGLRKSRLSAELDLAKTTQRVKHLEERFAIADREDIEPLKKTAKGLNEKINDMSDRCRESTVKLSRLVDTYGKKLTKIEKERSKFSSPPVKFGSFSSERSELSSGSVSSSLTRLSPLPRSITGFLPRQSGTLNGSQTTKTGSIFPRSLSFKSKGVSSPAGSSAPSSFSQPQDRACSASEPKKRPPLSFGKQDTDGSGSTHSTGKYSWLPRLSREEQRGCDERVYISSVPLPPENSSPFDEEHKIWERGTTPASESQALGVDLRTDTSTEPSTPVPASEVDSSPNLPDLPCLSVDQARSNSGSYAPERALPRIPDIPHEESSSHRWLPVKSATSNAQRQILSSARSVEDMRRRRSQKARDGSVSGK
ncbi:hypothetical protein N7539_003538 [Penicillium diatomitis]|uniref:Uncharacterized protein n=1 Tax=Penicillium diatomitis TaxID=2819901 RepID=A0A9W9XD29_9EURO|nr:uncharacterized protein N7539_003538 [Penicillium diatomitis]KAJ5488648.1 hypothetical protein N7539_003538 [Penicillium diatomitis]